MTFYPPTSFYFNVIINGSSDGTDTSFQDVSGISGEMTTEEVQEGGENRFSHHLPKQVKHSNLVLKRGIAETSSPLVQWCKLVIEGDLSAEIETKSLVVNLLDENKTPIRSWSFDNAYPVKWDISEFNSTKNEVSLETIEVSYNTCIREI